MNRYVIKDNLRKCYVMQRYSEDSEVYVGAESYCDAYGTSTLEDAHNLAKELKLTDYTIQLVNYTLTHIYNPGMFGNHE